jgi:hypothetical protein
MQSDVAPSLHRSPYFLLCFPALFPMSRCIMRSRFMDTHHENILEKQATTPFFFAWFFMYRPPLKQAILATK